MDYKAICGVVSYALTILGLLVYAKGIVTSNKKPSIATWVIWTLNSFLLPLSYRKLGAEETIWLAVGYTTGCVVITALVIVVVRGTKEWGKTELGCLIAALSAALLWWVTGSALVMFATALVIDVIGIVSTMENAWKHPEDESLLAWWFMAIGGAFGIFAVKQWSPDLSTFVDASYPIQITVTNVIVVLLLCLSNKKRLHRG